MVCFQSPCSVVPGLRQKDVTFYKEVYYKKCHIQATKLDGCCTLRYRIVKTHLLGLTAKSQFVPEF